MNIYIEKIEPLYFYTCSEDEKKDIRKFHGFTINYTVITDNHKLKSSYVSWENNHDKWIEEIETILKNLQK